MSAFDRHGPVVRNEQVFIADGSIWKKLWLFAGAIGAAALIAAFVLGMGDGGHGPEAGHEAVGGAAHHVPGQQLYHSYLTALMYFLALSLGGLFFVLIQHATRAGWSIVVRRLAENMALTLPLMAGLALVMVFTGTDELFHWLHPEGDPVLEAKAAYLNIGSFTTRAIVFGVIWTALALFFWLTSTKQDESADPLPLSDRMRWWAPLGLLLFGLSLTFAAFDWLMSLDPHWFSTIFGVYYFAGCVAAAHSFLAILIILLHRSGYLRGVITTEHFHDIGKMMFGFTVFWGYIGFSQYMLIWYASIPEETEWFSYRGQGDWLGLSLVLVFARFVIPFLGLMSRKIKRNPSLLGFWAVWLLVAEFIDLYWLIHPALGHHQQRKHIEFGALDILTFVGVGGLWLAVFLWGLSRKALVPLKDPRLQESIAFENF